MWDKVIGPMSLFASGATTAFAAMLAGGGMVAFAWPVGTIALLLLIIAGDRLWGARRAR